MKIHLQKKKFKLDELDVKNTYIYTNNTINVEENNK